MVEVLDSNDNGPIFRQETYFATLKENNKRGALVVEVSATDQDAGENGQIRYELHPDARRNFTIDPKSGIVLANVEFDREKMSNMEFRVLASDLGDSPHHTATTTVLLTILDSDDEAPRFTMQRFVFNVEENVPINTEVGQVTAADGDLPPYNQFQFGVLQADADASTVFELDPKNGVITTLRLLDREQKDVYSMQVVVYSKNKDHRNHTARVVIYIDDENDNDPVVDFPSDINNTVHISNQVPIGYVVTRIHAHDIDYGANQKLMYQLSQASNSGAFHIGESTGEVYVNKKFDTVKDEHHKLVILVKDHGYPQRISVATLHVIVNDSVPYRPHRADSSTSHGDDSDVSDVQMIIIICVVLGTVVLATLLVVAIVVLKRRETKQNSPGFVHKTEVTLTANTDNDSCDKIPTSSPPPNYNSLTEVGVKSGPGPEPTAPIYVRGHTVPDVAIAGHGDPRGHGVHPRGHGMHPEDGEDDLDLGSEEGGKVSLSYHTMPSGGGGRHYKQQNNRLPNGTAGHYATIGQNHSVPRTPQYTHTVGAHGHGEYSPKGQGPHYSVYMV